MSQVTARHFKTACTAAALALLTASSPVVEVQARQVSAVSTASWPQWGGPTRDFIAHTTTLPDAWPEGGPKVLWSRPLGTGHSAIVVDENRLYTMYRVGNGRARQGPWEAEEAVVALDATTGQTLWEHRPLTTRRLQLWRRTALDPTRRRRSPLHHRYQQAAAGVRKAFGKDRVVARPHQGICLSGAADSSRGQDRLWVQSHRLRRHDHLQRRRSRAIGDGVSSSRRRRRMEERRLSDIGSAAHPDRARGHAAAGVPGRWHDHGAGSGNRHCSLVAPARSRQRSQLRNADVGPGNNILFVSSAYKAGSRAIRLRKEGGATHAEELWFTNRVRFMFLNALRIGEMVYGTSGDFGPAFLTALNLRTGQQAWQHRGFGRASLIYADGKTIIMDEDGDLALARLAPEGATVLSQAKIFETTSWTVPTLVDGTLYARDREKIVALSVGERRPAASAFTTIGAVQSVFPLGGRRCTARQIVCWNMAIGQGTQPHRRRALGSPV